MNVERLFKECVRVINVIELCIFNTERLTCLTVACTTIFFRIDTPVVTLYVIG